VQDEIEQLQRTIEAQRVEQAAAAREAGEMRRELAEVKAAHRVCVDKAAAKDAAIGGRRERKGGRK
jgi:hypothetical protein